MSSRLINGIVQCRGTKNEIMHFSVGSNVKEIGSSAKEHQRANLFALKKYCNAPSSCFDQAGDRSAEDDSKQTANRKERKNKNKNMHPVPALLSQATDIDKECNKESNLSNKYKTMWKRLLGIPCNPGSI